jgi:hypothetical protein
MESLMASDTRRIHAASEVMRPARPDGTEEPMIPNARSKKQDQFPIPKAVCPSHER